MVTKNTFKQISFFSAALLLFMAAACKKDSTTDIAALPVVEAYLLPGNKVEVKVSLQKALVDTNAYGLPISGLTLTVSDGTTTKTLTESKTGDYTLNDLTFVKSSGTYSLSFTYNNLKVTATTKVPTKPANITLSSDTLEIPISNFDGTDEIFVPVYATWSNPNSDYHVLVFKNQDSFKTLISSRFNTDTVSSVELNTVQLAKYELAQNTFRYYGYYKVILMRVNVEYINMLNSSTRSATNLTNAPTNVTNGLGIFTAMQADTLATQLLVKEEDY